MKILKFPAAALLIIFSSSSCRKDYTCHCVYRTNGSDAYEQDTKIHAKKDDATSKCDASDFSKNVTVEDSTYLSTAECDLIGK